MFCGWRLVNSYGDLARLGSGTLSIDALAGSCAFEGKPIQPPSIAGELHAWLCEDLAAHGIPAGVLLRAKLAARIAITTIPPQQRATPARHLTPEGKPVRSGLFFRCVIECESEVATDEAVYRSRYADLEEWPTSWADA